MSKILYSVLVAAMIYGCSDSGNTQSTTDTQTKQSINGPFRVGDKIQLKSVTNADLTLIRTENGFKLDGSDKVIIFDVFGTYCQPCRDEAEHLMNFQIKHSNDVMLIGLIYYENVTDEHVLESFIKRYKAYYFISNSKQNPQIVEAITSDIGYPLENISLPFKVMIKDGKYQTLTDNYGDSKDKKYYLGKVDISTIEDDLNKIK